MNKSIAFLVVVIFAAHHTYGQTSAPNIPVDPDTKRITYTEVVQVDTGINKMELYSRAREWFAKRYNSSTDVIQMDDKENGKIVAKALIHIFQKIMGMEYGRGYINYTVSIYLKDGRYKYEVTNFYHTGESTSTGSENDRGPCELFINDQRSYQMMSRKGVQKTSNNYLAQMDENITGLLTSLKSSMSVKAKGSKDNW